MRNFAFLDHFADFKMCVRDGTSRAAWRSNYLIPVECLKNTLPDVFFQNFFLMDYFFNLSSANVKIHCFQIF